MKEFQEILPQSMEREKKSVYDRFMSCDLCGIIKFFPDRKELQFWSDFDKN